jgi:hypothetical protein
MCRAWNADPAHQATAAAARERRRTSDPAVDRRWRNALALGAVGRELREGRERLAWHARGEPFPAGRV